LQWIDEGDSLSQDERVAVDVYFDFACPYVHSAAVLMREVEQQLGDEGPVVRWRFFPLEQVNAPEDAEFAIWDLPADRRSRGRDSMHAAVAARRQGPEQSDRFRFELLALKHEGGLDHGQQSTLLEAATRADLALPRFTEDLEDRELLREIRDDYVNGREEFGVFGTPTFVFSNGQSAYLQVLPAPPPEKAVPFWNDFVLMVRDRPYLREIKRPRRAQ
jgi:predicted DsbA family dithiol-disulfide isomerase